MTDRRIEPAFSAEEWEKMRRDDFIAPRSEIYYLPMLPQRERVQALAPLNEWRPDGDARKFTRAQVDALREAVQAGSSAATVLNSGYTDPR